MRTELFRAVAVVLTGLALLFVLINNTALLFHILQSFSQYEAIFLLIIVKTIIVIEGTTYQVPFWVGSVGPSWGRGVTAATFKRQRYLHFPGDRSWFRVTLPVQQSSLDLKPISRVSSQAPPHHPGCCIPFQDRVTFLESHCDRICSPAPWSL